MNAVKKKAAPKKTPAKQSARKKTITRIRPEVLATLEQATRSGKWISLTLRIEDGKVWLDRTAMDFPKNDLDTALTMIVADLNRLKKEQVTVEQ